MLKIKLADGKRFFIRQTYPRGLYPGLRAAFLFRAYEEHEKEQAESHLHKIDQDPHRFLYDATREDHLQKLYVAAGQPPGFAIYYAGRKEQDWKPPYEYQLKLKNFIRSIHPEWKPKRGGDKIQAGLYEEYGELFLKLSFESENDLIPFETIENY